MVECGQSNMRTSAHKHMVLYKFWHWFKWWADLLDFPADAFGSSARAAPHEKLLLRADLRLFSKWLSVNYWLTDWQRPHWKSAPVTSDHHQTMSVSSTRSSGEELDELESVRWAQTTLCFIIYLDLSKRIHHLWNNTTLQAVYTNELSYFNSP